MIKKLICYFLGHKWAHAGLVLSDQATHHFWKCEICRKKKFHDYPHDDLQDYIVSSNQ